MGQIINIGYFLTMLLLISFLIKNAIEILFYLQNYAIHKRRLDQLLSMTDKDEASNMEKIDELTKPIVKNILPKLSKILPSLNVKNQAQMQMDLRMADWEDTFTVETLVATSLMTKALAIFMLIIGLVLPGKGLKMVAMLWSAALFFGFDFWFKSSVSGKKDKLFNDFPDFIRIASGYLSADVPLVQAISDSIKYVGEDWKPLLRQFVVECDTKGVDLALTGLRDNVDLFEVKEFVALVRLTLEQGGNAKDGFLAQAERITEMKRNLMIIKVGQRKVWAQVIQGPLLLCNMAVLALPTIANIQIMME